MSKDKSKEIIYREIQKKEKNKKKHENIWKNDPIKKLGVNFTCT